MGRPLVTLPKLSQPAVGCYTFRHGSGTHHAEGLAPDLPAVRAQVDVDGRGAAPPLRLLRFAVLEQATEGPQAHQSATPTVPLDVPPIFRLTSYAVD